MKPNVNWFIAVLAVTLALPFVAHGQLAERFSLGADAVVWGAPDLDNFMLAVSDAETTTFYTIDQNVLYGVRPFLRFGLIRELAIEISHEFAFGDDVDIMVSSASGIWRPFGETGLEAHASICFGQLDWSGPGSFDSNWGWEVGAGYSFRLSDSVGFVVGVAYRDLSFDYDLKALAEDLPAGSSATVSDTSLDSSGVVGTVGVFVVF